MRQAGTHQPGSLVQQRLLGGGERVTRGRAGRRGARRAGGSATRRRRAHTRARKPRGGARGPDATLPAAGHSSSATATLPAQRVSSSRPFSLRRLGPRNGWRKKSSEMSLRVVRGLASGAGAGFASTSASGGVSSMTSSAPKPAASYQGSTNSRGEPHGDGKRVFSSGRALPARPATHGASAPRPMQTRPRASSVAGASGRSF